MSTNESSSSTNIVQEQPEQIVPQLLPIEKNSESRRITILTNIVNMLTERGLLNFDNKSKDQYIK